MLRPMVGPSARPHRSWRRWSAALALSASVIGMVPAAVSAQDAADPEGREVNDPAVTEGLAWHLDRIGVPEAWQAGLGADVVVAVIDTGVDVTHPDLDHQVIESVSCIGAGGDPRNCQIELPGTGAETHGTHVAGLIAARADDRIGVAGVAPRAQLLVVRALQTSCGTEVECRPTGDVDDVAAGVRWATAAGADVINLSLNTTRLGGELDDALAEAWAAGVVPVLAAGPRSGAVGFFGGSSSLLVTSTDRAGELASLAPFLDADAPAVAAPGGVEGDTDLTCRVGGGPLGLLSAAARTEGDGSGYACLSGTSMAAAVVSGSIAVLLSMGYEPADAVDRLVITAVPGPGLGAGEIDLGAATTGSHPRGVSAREEPFDTGAPEAEVVAATSGPFRGVAPEPSRRHPTVLIPLLGGLAGGLLGALVLRVRRRRTERWAVPEAPHD